MTTISLEMRATVTSNIEMQQLQPCDSYHCTLTRKSSTSYKQLVSIRGDLNSQLANTSCKIGKKSEKYLVLCGVAEHSHYCHITFDINTVEKSPKHGNKQRSSRTQITMHSITAEHRSRCALSLQNTDHNALYRYVSLSFPKLLKPLW